MSDIVSPAGIQRRQDRNRLPRIRQNTSACDFQRNKNAALLKQRPNTEEPKPVAKKASLMEALPAIMKKLKTELGLKSFIVKTKQAVVRRKRAEFEERRLDRKWIKGNEMSPYFHFWQTSEDHIKDQHVRPGTVQRKRMLNSIPSSLKYLEAPVEPKNSQKAKCHDDFGIVRECCCKPKIRIRTIYDD